MSVSVSSFLPVDPLSIIIKNFLLRRSHYNLFPTPYSHSLLVQMYNIYLITTKEILDYFLLCLLRPLNPLGGDLCKPILGPDSVLSRQMSLSLALVRHDGFLLGFEE